MTCVRLRTGLYTRIHALLTAGVRLAYGQSEQNVRTSYDKYRMHLKYGQTGDIAEDLWAIAFAADPTRSRRVDA